MKIVRNREVIGETLSGLSGMSALPSALPPVAGRGGQMERGVTQPLLAKSFVEGESIACYSVRTYPQDRGIEWQATGF
jgi:hypothetical protein